MLSQYTWGQFGVFLFVLVVAYYAVVIFIYYRHDMGALFRRGGGGASRGGSAASASPAPGLVKTTSAFSANGAAAPAAATAVAPVTEPTEGHLTEASETLVTGQLPDSTALPSVEPNLGEEDEAAVAETEANSGEEDEEDEQENAEVDEADEALVAAMRLLSLPAQEQIEDELAQSEETEAPGPQQPATAAGHDLEDEAVPLPEYSFEPVTIPIASSLDVKPLNGEQLYTAASVAEYIAQVNAGEKPALPAELLDTRLSSQLVGLMEETTQELADLFAED